METHYLWLLLMTTFTLFMMVYITTKIIKTERQRISFALSIKPGDKVYSPVLDDKVKGEVLEVNNDEVVIKVTIPKNRVYSQK